jgi:DNA-binding NarL/FixJ family response regulator
MKKKYSILIVDDHLMIIEGYKTALKFGFSNFCDAKLEVDYAVNFNSAIEKINYSKAKTQCDLVVLDLSMPTCDKHKMNCGEDLGKWVQSHTPETKLLVITSYNDTIRINNVLNQLNPEGFLLKSEISAMDLVTGVHRVLENKSHYSTKVTEILKNRHKSDFHLDNISIQILKEISNGTKAKDLPNYIPMSKSGIEKRKRLLKTYFKTKDDSDRELIMAARERGYI